MFSKDNPKSLCGKDSLLKRLISIILAIIVIIIAMALFIGTFSFIGYLHFYFICNSVYNEHDKYNNSILDIFIVKCKYYTLPKVPCGFNSIDNLNECIGHALIIIINILVISLLIALPVLFLMKLRGDIKESFDSAQELTSIYVEENTTKKSK